MATEWYYAENDEQKGPVTFEALQGLAANGTLRPKDLVWKAGMPDWVPAQNQAGLFGEAVVPARRIRPAEGDEDRPRSRSSSRRPPRQEGMSTALKFGLIAGGASLVLLMVCAGVIGVIVALAASKEDKSATTNPPSPKIKGQPAKKGPQQAAVGQAQQAGERNWNLGVGRDQGWTIRFNQGDNVVIRVQSTFDSNVDLFVLTDKAKYGTASSGRHRETCPHALRGLRQWALQGLRGAIRRPSDPRLLRGGSESATSRSTGAQPAEQRQIDVQSGALVQGTQTRSASEVLAFVLAGALGLCPSRALRFCATAFSTHIRTASDHPVQRPSPYAQGVDPPCDR